MDLFSSFIGTIATHIATETPVIIKSISWYKNQMDFDVLVPMMNEKGKVELCHATYSQNELEF